MITTVLAVLAIATPPGGLCVQTGAGNLELVLSLARTGRFLVRVLDTDPVRVELARQKIDAAGVYGLASAGLLRSAPHLPLTENLVNLLLLESPGMIPESEIERVLCPGGVARTIRGESVVAKRRPPTLDEWTHPRHGADGNAVSHDAAAGPPRRLRWVAGPPFLSTGLLSAGGRNFYSGMLARDSFNGLRLWKESLTGSIAADGSEIVAPGMPAVALDDLVLAVRKSRVTALLPATGAPIREFPGLENPSELAISGRTLLACREGDLDAVEVDTGQLRWKQPVERPRQLAAGGDSVFFLHGRPERGQPVRICCRALADGKLRWERQEPWARSVRGLVYHRDRLAVEVSTLNDDNPGNAIHLLSAADGRTLWSHPFNPGMCHAKQARALFTGGRLWILDDGDHTGGKCTALDVETGAVVQQFPAGWGHCFPPVATERYLFSGEMHLTDLLTGSLDANRISKGSCSKDAGFVPANGLIYVTAQECVCWPMLRQNAALAPARAGGQPNEQPLEKLEFPVEHGVPAPQKTVGETADDWPCYRHDAWRSGSSPAPAPNRMRVGWTAGLGDWPQRSVVADDWRQNPFVAGPVTPPVIAGGRVCLARPDAHEVVALDAGTGQVCWRHRAAARVDTAPTLHAGLCLFGVKSGEVVCLRADDGRLVWRLAIAPLDEQIVAYGQLESPWPVPGSVLVVNGVAYIAAGRQVYSDGGILVLAIEPATGRVIWRQRLSDLPQKWFYGDNHCEFDAFDLLHREGDQVAMSRWLFDFRDGKVSVDDRRGFARLTTGGSGVWAPQGTWSYAPPYETIAHKIRPFRRPLVVFRDNTLYGCTEDKHSIYRRDFDSASGEPFNSEWYRGMYWLKAKRPNELWRSQRLAADAKWQAALLPEAAPQTQIAAMVLCGTTLITVDSEGRLRALDTTDGHVTWELQLPPPVWDGLAAANGKLYLTTIDGRILCLE